MRRRKPTSSVLPEKEYDDERPELPVIIIVASTMINGDRAPARGSRSDNMVPKNLAVGWARMLSYL